MTAQTGATPNDPPNVPSDMAFYFGGKVLPPFDAAARSMPPAEPSTAPVRKRSTTRWHKTSTTLGPVPKLVITVVMLVAALWSPVHALLSSPSQPAANDPGVSRIITGTGSQMGLPNSTIASVAAKGNSVGSGLSSLNTAGDFVTWAVYLLIAAGVLYFVWKPGVRVITVPANARKR